MKGLSPGDDSAGCGVQAKGKSIKKLMKISGSVSSVRAVILAIAISFAVAPCLHADGNRKVLANPKPSYPDLAKKLRLSGTVKIEVSIGANGLVKDAKPLGGHPVLVDAAVRALKDWKFEAAGSTTTEVLEFKFDMQ